MNIVFLYKELVDASERLIFMKVMLCCFFLCSWELLNTICITSKGLLIFFKNKKLICLVESKMFEKKTKNVGKKTKKSILNHFRA